MNEGKKTIGWKAFGRVVIFIDVANVIYSLRDLGWKLGYKNFQHYFRAQTQLVDIYVYGAFFDTDARRKNFFEMLSRKGFKLRTKLVKEIRTADGPLHKGNCDVELTMDALLLHPSFDTAILLSGDSDFAPLITFLQQQNKKVVVISTRGHVAREMVQTADLFLPFDRFRKDWELTKKSRSSDERSSR